MKLEKYNRDWHKEFVYNESSPSCLVWKNDRYRGNLKNPYVFIAKGSPVGYLSPTTGYWNLCMYKDSERIDAQVHRIIYQMHYGDFQDNSVVDHIDGDKSNNRVTNLRLVPSEQNTRNAKKYKNNTTGVVGVYKEEKGNWSRYKAMWVDLDGVQRSKSFNINKYGEELAEFLAQEYRQHQIDLLNLKGAGYTVRHGT